MIINSWKDGKEFPWYGNYEGELKEGVKCGYGIMTWVIGKRKGRIYRGHWLNNLPEGTGMYKWSNGTVYEGD